MHNTDICDSNMHEENNVDICDASVYEEEQYRDDACDASVYEEEDQDRDDACDPGVYDMYCSISGECEIPSQATMTKIPGYCTRIRNLYLPPDCRKVGNIYTCKEGLFASCDYHMGKGRHVIINKNNLEKQVYAYYGEYSDYRSNVAMERQSGWEFLFVDKISAQEDDQLITYLQSP